MPHVEFSPAFQRQTQAPSRLVSGRTVVDVLENVFLEFPELRGYVLEDAGSVRKHVVIFLNSTPIVDRHSLSDSVQESDRIFVFQALSGG